MSKVEKITERIDEYGEITKTAEIINIKPLPAEPPYVKMYIDDIGRMSGLQTSHVEILTYVAAIVDYEGIVTLNARRKACIAATVKGSVKTVENAITEYIKAGLLVRIGRAEYELNPNLFARGEWRTIRERREAFTVKVTYSKERGREMKMQRMSQDEQARAELESLGQQRLAE